VYKVPSMYARNFSIVCTNMLTISYILVSNNVYSVRNERSRTYLLSPDHFPPRITLEKKQTFTLFCFSLVSFTGFSQWRVEP
jgi:hypothetical protein